MATFDPYTDPTWWVANDSNWRAGELLNATKPLSTPDPGCDNIAVKLLYWVYATLPISAGIIFIFAFFEERVKLCPTCCFQRPAIPYPVNLVDSYDDRWSFASAFSVMSTSVLQLFTGDWIIDPDLSGIPYMLQGTIAILVGLANVLVISLVFYPILLCLRFRSTHGLIGNSIGLLYTNIWFIYNIMQTVFCGRGQGLSRNTTIALTVPVYINYIFLNISFVTELLRAIKKNLHKPKEITVHAEEEDYFKKTHYYERVKYLFTPPNEKKEKRWLNVFIRKIWIDAPGFRYSTRNICTVVLSTITTYQVGLLYITFVNSLWERKEELLGEDSLIYKAFSLVNATSYVDEARTLFDIAEDTFWAACYFAIALAVLYNFLVQICYREHTVLLWRGVRDFCPKENFSLPALVVANLRYSGYAIAFSAWGFLITQFVAWLLLFFVAYFIIYQLNNYIRKDGELTWLLSFLEGYWLTFVVGFVLYYLQVAFANMAFLQKEKEKAREKVHLSLNNRRLFHWTVYITLFMNAVMGLVSCLMRIIKAVVFGVLFIGRVDKCTLMRGWELWDPGFKSYLGFLQLEVAHTHPVLITFCHFLWKSVGKDIREKRVPLIFWRRKPAKLVNDSNELSQVTSSGHSRKKLWPRNKWFVALTLMRNRTLTVDRMRISPELQQVKEQLKRERQESDKFNTELTVDEQDVKRTPTEEGRLLAADNDKSKGQVSTEAEISRDLDATSPEPIRPAARPSPVAWEGQAASAKSYQNTSLIMV